MFDQMEYYEHCYNNNFNENSYNLDIRETESFNETFNNCFYENKKLSKDEFLENFMKIDYDACYNKNQTNQIM